MISGTTGRVSRSAARVFNQGNYLGAMLSGDRSSWHYFAARGIYGHLEEALDGLSHFDVPESSYYAGVSAWIAGDKDRARKILRDCPTEEAARLLSLISRPRIIVLGHSQFGVPEGIDSQFEFQAVEDWPYTDVTESFDPKLPPDFYIALMVEASPLVLNLPKLPCPIFGATADCDLQAQVSAPWLQLFDHIVVVGEQEWRKARGLSVKPTSTFDKLYGLRADFYRDAVGKAEQCKERDIDLFLSGTVLHPYHRDKFQMINELLNMQGLNCVVAEGFLFPEEYSAYLLRSKLSLTFVRHPDSMPTRGLEALAHGCAVLTQSQSALTRYFSEHEGLEHYTTPHDIPPLVEKILASWDDYRQRTLRGARLVRRHFAMPETFSSTLRYLTFLTSKHTITRSNPDYSRTYEKEMMFFRGPNPPYEVRQYRLEVNLKRWKETENTPEHHRSLITLGRELAIEWGIKSYLPAIHSRREARGAPNPALLRRALEFNQNAMKVNPYSLVARFNFIRIALHFGHDAEVLKGLELLEETLQMDEALFRFDPIEDVFPWDFFPVMFNYRRYLDGVTEHLALFKDSSSTCLNTIRASLFAYLGHYKDPISNLEKACELEPEHDYYKLALARELVVNGSEIERGTRLLTELGRNSMYFGQAIEFLKALYSKGLYRSDEAEELFAKLDRYQRSTPHPDFHREEIGDPSLRPLPLIEVVVRAVKARTRT